MNKLLVSTDFSESSQQSLRYAFQLAEKLDKKLHIIHVLELYQYAAGTTESDLISSILPPENIMEMEHNASNMLRKFVNTIVAETGSKASFEMKVLPGHLVNDTVAESLSAECELIIVPLPEKKTGVTRFTHKVITSIINDSIVPVLAVKGIVFEPFKKILYVTDFKRTNLYALKHLVDLFSINQPQITIVHIAQKKNDFKSELLFDGFKNRVREEIQYNNFVFESRIEKNTINGIIQSVRELKAQCVVMLKDSESLFSSFFETSNTEKLSLTTDVPMIVYHNQHPQEIYK